MGGDLPGQSGGVGWIAAPDRDIFVRMERVKHYLSICNSAPGEHLARIALKARDHIFRRKRALLTSNLGALEQFFRRHADRFDWYRPEAGCVAYPRYKGAEGVDRWTIALVERTGVLLLPSAVYKSETDANSD